MADNNSRSFRSRDPRAGEQPAPMPPRDPLAELARLIGQTDTTGGDYGARQQPAETYADAQPDAMEWSADDGYAPPAPQPDYHQPDYHQPGHQQSDYRQPDYQPSEYQQPEYQQPEYHPAQRAAQPPESHQGRSSQDYASYSTQPLPDSEPEVQYVPPPAARLSPPAVDYGDTRYGAGNSRDVARDGYADDYSRDDGQGYERDHDQGHYEARQGTSYDDADQQAVPPLAPHADDQQQSVDQWEDNADDPSYATDEDGEPYEDDEPLPPPPMPRRSGFATALAVLCLAATGSAGAFAYHSMFGSAMLPAMPPIIKPSDGPNKIVPNRADTQANAGQTPTSAGTGEKLVSREEQPVDIPTAPKNSPRVVSTIPVLPTPGPSPSETAAMTPVITPSSAAPFPPAPPAAGSLVAPMPATPAPSVATPSAPQAASAPAPGSAEPKKVHTVAIHQEPPRPKPAPASAAPRSTGGNAPLSLVPNAEGDAPAAPAAPRTQVARATPPGAPAATAPATTTGGYAVQLSSQRSEAEAQSAYRDMQGRYPSQLASRTPIIRRAELGAKGTYYRTLVGPFATHEQAEALCSSLKAAGGTCIVQKN
jgi:SPOR domain